MGLKINAVKVPIHWRLLIGAQVVFVSAMIMWRIRLVNERSDREESKEDEEFIK